MGKLSHSTRVDSNRLAEEYYDSLMIRYSYIDNVEADLSYEIFGRSFRTPIMGAGLGLHKQFHESGSLGYGKGIADSGSLNFNGWMDDEEFAVLCQSGIPTIRGVKPFADHDRIYQCIEHDERNGALGICMDIDHIFNKQGKYDFAPYGQLGPQTMDDLRGYITSTKLPFILKGVLSVRDAVKALEIGASAIILSNHNNRFPSAIPPLLALPDIKKAVGQSLPILVDGCIESGVEAFKALALGADGVLACRVLMNAFIKGGPEGVAYKLSQMSEELAGCMSNTGADNVANINRASIQTRYF